jgi:hypothetical protein
MIKRFLILFGFAFFNMQAQNFNYQYSTSSNTYTELSNPVYIAANGNWINSYAQVPIDFSFNYLGNTFDSVKVFANGYLVFDNNFNYGFAVFGHNISNQQDSVGNNLSSVSYSISGTTGSRILKIQFKNCAIANENGGMVNYQVWLQEGSNSISVSIGSNTYDISAIANYPRTIGLVDMNLLEDKQKGLLLTGSSASPITSVINYNGKYPRVSEFPQSNTIYSFTPNF